MSKSPNLASASESVNKPGRTLDERLSVLLDEIQLAFSWDRPSILLAIQNTKTGLKRAKVAFEAKLTALDKKVVHIDPEDDQKDVLHRMLTLRDPEQFVFFVQNLGSQKEVYDSLNLHRETAVEQRLKIVFWLTEDEVSNLSRLAPDFWAFRHRTIEFSARSGFRHTRLPAGILLWGINSIPSTGSSITGQIEFKKHLLETLPSTRESSVMRTDTVYNLAYLHWFNGENKMSEMWLLQELEQAEVSLMRDKKSLLLNGLAINHYDQGNFKDALRLLETAFDINPHSDVLMANHGIACRSAGQSGQSLKWIHRALRLNPEAHYLWGVLGYMFVSMGKYHDALPAFEKALYLFPGHDHYRYGVVICHSRMGNHALLEKTLQAMPEVVTDYQQICMDGLAGDRQNGLERLKHALAEDAFPLAFVKHDPGLNMIYYPEELMNVLS